MIHALLALTLTAHAGWFSDMCSRMLAQVIADEPARDAYAEVGVADLALAQVLGDERARQELEYRIEHGLADPRHVEFLIAHVKRDLQRGKR